MKTNTAVKFRTRQDRPLMRGTVKRTIKTVKGAFLQIAGDDGVQRRVRPCYVTEA